MQASNSACSGGMRLGDACRAPRPFSSAPKSVRCIRAVRTTAIRSQSGVSDEAPKTSRRSLLAAALVGLPAATFVAPQFSLAAQRPALRAQYYEATAEVHRALHRVLDISPEATESQNDDRVSTFRDEANKWVADYRRTMSNGRKSFAETYAAINTIQGFYTTRGDPQAPFPAKVRDGAAKKLASAEAALKREQAKEQAAAAAA